MNYTNDLLAYHLLEKDVPHERVIQHCLNVPKKTRGVGYRIAMVQQKYTTNTTQANSSPLKIPISSRNHPCEVYLPTFGLFYGKCR